MPDLLDASVWLPLSAPGHPHHERALRYWHEESAEKLVFCRVTALALLRHLSSSRVLGPAALDGGAAYLALTKWLSVPGVEYYPEPTGIDELLGRWSQSLDIRAGHWTDAYLAAFAAGSGCRLVAFDGDFHLFPGLDFLHLAV